MKKYNLSQPYKPEVLDKLHQVQLEILKDFSNTCDKFDISYFAVYGTAIGAVRHGGFIPWDDDVDVALLRKDYDKFLELFQRELGDKYEIVTPETRKGYACTVTHLQKRGTKFVSEMSKDLNCELGISIDLFPLDYVAADKKAQLRQGRGANFYGKLLFLAGTPEPIIPSGGVLSEMMSMACRCIHYMLRAFHISPVTLYQCYKKMATRYNHSPKKGKYVTSFEYMGCLKDKVKEKDIFPLQVAEFENMIIKLPNNNHAFLQQVYGDYMKIPPEEERINHMPISILFGDEE